MFQQDPLKQDRHSCACCCFFLTLRVLPSSNVLGMLAHGSKSEDEDEQLVCMADISTYMAIAITALNS